MLSAKGIDTSKPIIAHCMSGMSATYPYAALKHAGVEKVSVYDGSWSEYSAKKKE